MPPWVMSEQERCFYQAVGEQIEEARRTAGMTKHGLARAIGMRQGNFSHAVAGQQRWTVFQLRKIANVLGIPVQCLIPRTVQYVKDR